MRKRNNLYGYFTLRENPALVNELWQGDHHVFDLFVRVTVKRQSGGQILEKESAVRPALTAWMDTATGCIVGWVISILPNSDTIAEAFCRAAALTKEKSSTGFQRRSWWTAERITATHYLRIFRMKSIERMFRTLEREWICKLKGWCRSSVKERPNGFAKHLRKLLEKQELLTMDAFVQKFQSEILPSYLPPFP